MYTSYYCNSTCWLDPSYAYPRRARLKRRHDAKTKDFQRSTPGRTSPCTHVRLPRAGMAESSNTPGARRRPMTSSGTASAAAAEEEALRDMLTEDADKDLITAADAEKSRRPPQLSVGKYNQWMIVEGNRELGVEVRAEEAALQRRLEQSKANYHEARQKKTSVGRGQQELTAGAVREYRGALAKAGESGRSELMHLRAIALRQKKEWAAHGARNAAVHGLEQKKRVLEARAERFQTRRNAALQTKQDLAARKASARVLAGQDRQGRLERLERVRQQIPDAASLADAREFFAKQKREAAAQVRSSVKEWEEQKKRSMEVSQAKASATRNVVMATRVEAANNIAKVKESRAKLAHEIRKALDQMESTRREKIELTKQNTQAHYKDLYERRFVAPEAATRVDESEYGALIQQVRHPGARSSLSSTSLLGSASAAALQSQSKPEVEEPKEDERRSRYGNYGMRGQSAGVSRSYMGGRPGTDGPEGADAREA